MTKAMTLPDCIRLAEFAHFHQTDQAGHPYIEHPKRVLKSVQADGAPPYVQMAAILHDVTEDTPFTAAMLIDLGVLAATVELVCLLDRNYSRAWYEDERAKHNIACSVEEFYYLNIKKNPGARQVKFADIGDNLQPWRLSYLPEHRQIKLQDKYTKALAMLA